MLCRPPPFLGAAAAPRLLTWDWLGLPSGDARQVRHVCHAPGHTHSIAGQRQVHRPAPAAPAAAGGGKCVQFQGAKCSNTFAAASGWTIGERRRPAAAAAKVLAHGCKGKGITSTGKHPSRPAAESQLGNSTQQRPEAAGWAGCKPLGKAQHHHPSPTPSRSPSPALTWSGCWQRGSPRTAGQPPQLRPPQPPAHPCWQL